MVGDVVPAPKLPELIAEVAMEVEELAMKTAVMPDQWAVEPM